ncbi:Brix-domain-containing protein [Gloeophyllum trabeum ATCC 11539]|uniref:Ribosome production factor 2 homolog n=1 Tax=Gloeophyllum trabeum (strain ATCC 11539 / FP-39264 / Madison 617) TaxID=670483 RepID=S7PSD5_GLOTA|nr:Brix-domain-containing protein [Gloeophyllum trabeum ATCC 11539]EPQ50726.1 Brix-domain-containing protein [Gloeophyllum trabeum ATCC 11539]
MLRTVKPKNARSKRALEAREPKEVEGPRQAIFVKGTHTGEIVNNAMKELMALKRPDAISFSKKNPVHPFEDASSLEFWAQKNDASLFVVGQSTKKRPHGLTFVRMFDCKVLDMCEVGIEAFVSMHAFKTPKSTPGHRPLLHFAGELFDTHPRLAQLKSLLLAFFGGPALESIHVPGLEHVVSVSLAPAPPARAADDGTLLPRVHLRTYTVTRDRAGRAALAPMGPFLDLALRRHVPPEANAHLLALAMKRPKLKKQDVQKGLGKRRRNVEVDEMGDVRGRVHLGKQELGGLRGKRMKALRGGPGESGEESEEERPRERKRSRSGD